MRMVRHMFPLDLQRCTPNLRVCVMVPPRSFPFHVHDDDGYDVLHSMPAMVVVVVVIVFWLQSPRIEHQKEQHVSSNGQQICTPNKKNSENKTRKEKDRQRKNKYMKKAHTFELFHRI